MAFAHPEDIIRQFGLHAGETVVDLGCGAAGHYVFPAARAVGESGKVYGIEIQPDHARKVKRSAEELGFDAVEVIVGDIERPHGTKLADALADAAILTNVLFQLENKSAAVDEAKRILRPRGRLLLVDWTDSFGGLGPPPADVFPEASARKLFEERGFEAKRAIAAGDHHYGIVFVKHG